MTIKVAINGYGRIGRNILRSLYESKRADDFKIVAINSLSSVRENIHLTRFDTTHGRFAADVHQEGNDIVINGDLIKVFCEHDPENIPWASVDVDIVFECTGYFTERKLAEKHLKAGAKKVLISAPGKNVDATVVYGVNNAAVKPEHTIISNASCTTNCLAPVAKVFNDAIGIESGMMVTVHAFTNDQVLVDANHQDLRRARSATQSIIPTKTGAAQAVGLVIPELDGKLDGYAVRVPTINVSMVDFTFVPKQKTSAEAINKLMAQAAADKFKDIIEINEEPLVSIDFNHNPSSAIFDATQTRSLGNQVNVVCWYDNEWGFSNRMLDVAALMKG